MDGGPRKTRGGQRKYSDLAIEICLTLRVAFRLALRQTQGFMRSIAKLMGLALPVPDFSTLSRRGKRLKEAQKSRASDKPITLMVDSTGLKVHSEVGWNRHKHGAKGAEWPNADYDTIRAIRFSPEVYPVTDHKGWLAIPFMDGGGLYHDRGLQPKLQNRLRQIMSIGRRQWAHRV